MQVLTGTKKGMFGRMAALALIGACPLAMVAQQETGTRVPQLRGLFGVVPWTQGTSEDALIQSARGTALPLFSHKLTSTKDGKAYTSVMVGGNPWSATKNTTPVKAVVVPLKISIGTITFDPTVADGCAPTSAVAAFNASPLVLPTSISYNGVNITGQYVDGFRQAEFSSLVAGTNYSNPLTFTTASAFVVSSATIGTNGIATGSGCQSLGLVTTTWLDSYLTGTVLPALKTAGVISPSTFVIFLMKNVVGATNSPPTVAGCCVLGYHAATGTTTLQTYAPFDWDTTGLFGPNGANSAAASHEIAEWMDDPLGTNPTPAWGGIGQVVACQLNLEVADPLTGTDILINGYNMQELAFFSWYFNSTSTASLGTGGKFSSNGTFGGPSKVCPSGGTN